jgi:hypothetical protein
MNFFQYQRNRYTYPHCLKGTNIYYWPVPKNACTSIKKAVYDFNYNESFQAQVFFGKKVGIHGIFPAKTNKSKSIDTSKRNFCIIRDPVSRFISLYTNKVLHRKVLEKYKPNILNKRLEIAPDINYFVDNFESYASISATIKTHAVPQFKYLGESPEKFWKIYNLSEISLLQADIRLVVGDKFKIKHFQNGGTELKEYARNLLSPSSIQKIKKLYSIDYEVFGKYLSE